MAFSNELTKRIARRLAQTEPESPYGWRKPKDPAEEERLVLLEALRNFEPSDCGYDDESECADKEAVRDRLIERFGEPKLDLQANPPVLPPGHSIE